MQAAAPEDTGALKQSINGTVTKKANGVSITWVANQPYAAVQDQGFQEPKRGPRAGQRIEFKNHPKGGGSGYMTRTFNANLRPWQGFIARRLRTSNR